MGKSNLQINQKILTEFGKIKRSTAVARRNNSKIVWEIGKIKLSGISGKTFLQINQKIVSGIGKCKLSGSSGKTILQINQKIVSEIEMCKLSHKWKWTARMQYHQFSYNKLLWKKNISSSTNGSSVLVLIYPLITPNFAFTLQNCE